VVFESWMELNPSWKSADEVDDGGMAPERMSAVAFERVDWRYPDAVRLVEETEAKVVCPETARFAVERLVEETFVEETLFAERLVDDTEARLLCPVTVKVPTWKEPLPVAFVKVIAVEETEEKTGVEVTPMVPEAEMKRFEPILKVDEETPPITTDEVVM